MACSQGVMTVAARVAGVHLVGVSGACELAHGQAWVLGRDGLCGDRAGRMRMCVCMSGETVCSMSHDLRPRSSVGDRPRSSAPFLRHPTLGVLFGLFLWPPAPPARRYRDKASSLVAFFCNTQYPTRVDVSTLRLHPEGGAFFQRICFHTVEDRCSNVWTGALRSRTRNTSVIFTRRIIY
jgi:hypothetical protein